MCVCESLRCPFLVAYVVLNKCQACDREDGNVCLYANEKGVYRVWTYLIKLTSLNWTFSFCEGSLLGFLLAKAIAPVAAYAASSSWASPSGKENWLFLSAIEEFDAVS